MSWPCHCVMFTYPSRPISAVLELFISSSQVVVKRVQGRIMGCCSILSTLFLDFQHPILPLPCHPLSLWQLQYIIFMILHCNILLHITYQQTSLVQLCYMQQPFKMSNVTHPLRYSIMQSICISHKMAAFIITTVRISNPSYQTTVIIRT